MVSKLAAFDTSEDGFRTVVEDYQERALRVLWRSPGGLNSREVWLKVNEALGPDGNGISRASIINFLEFMRLRGVLRGIDRTGKGGHYWIYVAEMGESEFKRYVAKYVIAKLFETWPDATKEAIEEIFR